MKKAVIILTIIFSFTSIMFCQTEEEIKSDIEKVIIFTKGAQVQRKAEIMLTKGQTLLKLSALSPYIHKQSIRIKGNENFSILNVRHQNDYLSELEKNQEITNLLDQIKELELKIEEEETWLTILRDKLDFLKSNKDITGKEQALDPTTFNELNEFYGQNLEKLNIDILKRQRQIKTYKEQMQKINAQINTMNSKANLPSGTILINIESKMSGTTDLVVTYYVDNASWYPSYDFRFKGINKPLAVTYKANITQNTGIDWNNAKIILSTSKTNLSAQIPGLNPFYLSYYYPKFKSYKSEEYGFLDKDISSSEMLEETVAIRGMSSVQGNQEPLYIVDGIPKNNINNIDPEFIENVEVLRDASATAIYGNKAANGVVIVTTKKGLGKLYYSPLTTTRIETSHEYEIQSLQTILSDNRTITLPYKFAELEADFDYQSVPKLSPNVYLIARLSDWYKAELLDGTVNIYLEESYVGTSNVNSNADTDTLEISFGTDNNISIKREKLADFSETRLIGMNRTETLAYKITVRNNKSYGITTNVFDQIPVSTDKDIEVKVLDISGAELEDETGKLKWKIELMPNETKELIIKYSVKYPKDKKVITE